MCVRIIDQILFAPKENEAKSIDPEIDEYIKANKNELQQSLSKLLEFCIAQANRGFKVLEFTLIA